ncbi:MAG: DUF4369 domain-containing protein, partial [Bacteroidales bacterium]|nr:DUF4369 domain-containing protein [Bacteroidales bacterium]
MKSKIYGLILSMVCAMGLSAQVVITDSIPSVRGYDVKLTTNRTEKNGHNVYIIGFEGGVPYCLDSAVFKKGVAEFKSKKVVPCGIYAFALNSNSRPFANFILNQQNKFTVDIKDENSSEFQKVTVTGSDENSLFFDFIYNTPNDLKEISRKRMNLLETMPDAFVTKYIMAAYGADPQRLQNSRSQQELTNTFLKVTDLSEPRMLYTPIRVPSMVELPIDKEEITECAAIIEYVDDIVSRCQAQNIRNFIISRLFKTLDTHNPDYDPAMVYLYDHFDHSWIEEGSERRIERKINNLKKIIPGAQIPELVSHDIN